MDLDLNRLNGTGVMTRKLETVRFAVAAKSFFSILVFNDLLRVPEQGSMALIPQDSTTLPAALSASLNQLTVEKLPSTQQFDLAVRDAKTGFVFFNIQGHQYDYDANAQLLSLNGGRLVISREFANALGWSSEAGSEAGKFPSARQCSRFGWSVSGKANQSTGWSPLLQESVPIARPTWVPTAGSNCSTLSTSPTMTSGPATSAAALAPVAPLSGGIVTDCGSPLTRRVISIRSAKSLSDERRSQ